MKKTLKMASIALAMSAALFTVQAGAAGADAFTPEQQARIGEIAADYLVAHPDVLIEMSKKLQVRQQAMQQQAYVQSVLKTHRLLMQLDGVPVKGPADSKVIVTEFFDYECIACSMMAPVMEKVMTANAGVRFAFRDWTIFAARFPESAQASRRGLSIYRKHGADAYMAFHNGIYQTGHNEGKLTAEDIEKAGIAAGTDYVSDENNSAADQIIQNNADLAEMLGLTGTPGIIVMPAENATPDNTTVIPGVVSEQVMQQAIARAEKG
ncbi:DsbA family protein [Pantoea agglomerans]|uniref:Thioredoxin domain-containing protein n=1 Tax=Enterobacter agglomerans TaxID=549 RepID=A0AAN2FHG2_ENTAG|nr:DsbA family protein [Pantoea agglomerans]CAH6374618.1 thioredoxin domain-containing protein [Pantoea agglomerans]